MAIYRKGADPEALDAAAGRLVAHAAGLDHASDAVRDAVSRLRGEWVGSDLDTLLVTANAQALPALSNASGRLTTLSGALTRNAARQRGTSLASTSAFTPAFLPGSAPAGGSGGGDGSDRRGRRDRGPDGRDGRRADNDDRSRGRGREDRRDNPRSGSSVSNDWAGRSILDRYLTGGGD